MISHTPTKRLKDVEIGEEVKLKGIYHKCRLGELKDGYGYLYRDNSDKWYLMACLSWEIEE